MILKCLKLKYLINLHYFSRSLQLGYHIYSGLGSHRNPGSSTKQKINKVRKIRNNFGLFYQSSHLDASLEVAEAPGWEPLMEIKHYNCSVI